MNCHPNTEQRTYSAVSETMDNARLSYYWNNRRRKNSERQSYDRNNERQKIELSSKQWTMNGTDLTEIMDYEWHTFETKWHKTSNSQLKKKKKKKVVWSANMVVHSNA